MLLPSVRSIGLVVLGILSVFSNVLNALDLSRPKKPLGPLGVTLDYSFAMNWPKWAGPEEKNVERNWVFSSHLEFANPVDDEISDGQLWQIARDAVDEMEKDMRENYGIVKARRPGAMAVLAFGKEIIIASSPRGDSSFSYEYKQTQVLDTLELCQTIWRDNGGSDTRHRSDGRCAEMIASHLYYFTTDIPIQLQHARIGTWTAPPRSRNWRQREPCGDPREDTWGCNLAVADMNLRVLPTDTPPKPYDLKTLAGGVSVRNQIQLCSVIRRDA